jgi:hypothetical protein
MNEFRLTGGRNGSLSGHEWHRGDVARRATEVSSPLKRLHGIKHLIRGNCYAVGTLQASAGLACRTMPSWPRAITCWCFVIIPSGARMTSIALHQPARALPWQPAKSCTLALLARARPDEQTSALAQQSSAPKRLSGSLRTYTDPDEPASVHGQRRSKPECLGVGLSGHPEQNLLDCWSERSMGACVSRGAGSAPLP